MLILTAGSVRRMIVVYTSCGKRVGWEKKSDEELVPAEMGRSTKCDKNQQPPQMILMPLRFRVHSHHVLNKFNLG